MTDKCNACGKDRETSWYAFSHKGYSSYGAFICKRCEQLIEGGPVYYMIKRDSGTLD